MPVPLLDVRNLAKCYGPNIALAGVTFQVAEGELFGLLGPNGAGKTTLLSIVSSLLEADGGEVRLDGKPLSPRDRGLRRLIGIVPQELALYGELTARENLAFFGSLYGLRGAELRRRLDEVLAAVALADRADGRADTFSGGMKRRLNLGCALVHGPRLLLLDEPTTGVDPQSRNHIFEEVRRLNAAGVTVVYTSHYMEEVQALCSRVGIIDHGRLVACDTLAGLLRQFEGRIRFRVRCPSPLLWRRLLQLPDAALMGPDGRRVGWQESAGGETFQASAVLSGMREQPAPALEGAGAEEVVFELKCSDVKTTLVRLVSLLNDVQAELTDLETHEPNLERVFLHLTGRALRD